MRRVGWIFLAIAFAAALLTIGFGRENVWLLSTFGIAIVLGTALLGSTSVARLYRGDVRIRPWDAAKKSFVIFLIILAIRLLAWAFFQTKEFDLTESIFKSAVFAIFFGLYTTADRKPA